MFMHHIQIRNFGPLQKIDLKLNGPKSSMVLIGMQASGKSTLAKTIYFCRKIKDFLVDYLTNIELFESTHRNERYLMFLKTVRKSFMGYFGTTKHMSPFTISFTYDAPIGSRKVSINLGYDTYARIVFSPQLRSDIESLINDVSDIYSDNHIPDISQSNDLSTLLKLKMKIIEIIQQHVSTNIKLFFKDEYEAVYIPAGRSLLASLSEQLVDINESQMDMAMQDFIRLIKNTKFRFGSRLPDIVKTYVKTIKGQINNVAIENAEKLIKSILKADYRNESDGEKLYYDEDHWTKLMYGSSGQQEALWILLLIFTIILDNQKVFMVIEEPEAHLFPDTQKQIVELMSLMVNSSQSEVFVTTHSPYILTSYNLLLQSAKVENNSKNKSNDVIVPRQMRIERNDFSAFIIRPIGSGTMETLIDEQTGLINASEIDIISGIINKDAERLIDLEIQYDM